MSGNRTRPLKHVDRRDLRRAFAKVLQAELNGPPAWLVDLSGRCDWDVAECVEYLQGVIERGLK